MRADTTTTTTNQVTREGWLIRAAEALWPRIVEAGGTKPERYRVSCGWPSNAPLMRASSKNRTLGEAWHAGSEDGARETFISPVLHQPVEVLDVLAHEMVHMACPPGSGHGPVFAAIARRAGLTEGKPTQARAGAELLEELAQLADELGPYPHAKLDRAPVVRQKARLMKVSCPDCGCIVRMTRTWIDTYLPTCGCGATMISDEYDVEGEPLLLETAAVIYTTQDGRFQLSTTKTGRVEARWLVRELFTVAEDGEAVPSERLTYRANREDALGFIAAVREGEADFPEVDYADEGEDEDDWSDEWDLDDPRLGTPGDFTADEDDLFLADDEQEKPDYEDGTLSPEEETDYERQAAGRERRAPAAGDGA